MNQIGEPITTHEISVQRGKLVKHESHRRDRSSRIDDLLNQTAALIGEEFREYLTILCQKKPRYVKEQLGLVVNACKAYGREAAMAAMRYCQEMELYSAGDLNDAAGVLCAKEPTPVFPEKLPVQDERYHVKVQKRELTVYADVASKPSLRESIREGGEVI